MKSEHPPQTEDVLKMVRERTAIARQEAAARRLAGTEARRQYMQTLNSILETRHERMNCFGVLPPPAEGSSAS